MRSGKQYAGLSGSSALKRPPQSFIITFSANRYFYQLRFTSEGYIHGIAFSSFR